MTTPEAPPRPTDRPGNEDVAREQRRRPRGPGRRRVCKICQKAMCSPADEYRVDYKDVARLRLLIDGRGRIEPRRKTGACLRGQHAIARAVKRARHLALLPYTEAHTWRSRGTR